MSAPGDKCWVWDINSRVYGEDRRPTARGHFRESAIDGETRHSWIVGPYKFDKETLWLRDKDWGHHKRLFLSAQDVEDYVFIDEHRYRIADAVGKCGDAATLRACAAAIGYEVKP